LKGKYRLLENSTMKLPENYEERVYAGVLGKMIGVYLGRPFEGWSHDRIIAELGEIWYYVHEKLGLPLVVTDDDITGTFTFLRALTDYGNGRELTPAQIGQTWLNYVIEGQSIFWWGGMGNSTEHTAFIRLKNGIPAPQSGSIALNGKIIAEQIGAQIFIDGWAMIVPGDPELAVDLAHKAASVSHDGEAIYGAQVLAAMEAQAFVESDLNKLLNTAITFIPKDSNIYRLIADLREWHVHYPDWHIAREKIEAQYGYEKYPGECHVVPNHALIQLGLLYGEDDFQKSLMITNTSGWDTDCNSGNVGCLLGIKNGLKAIDTGPDWRGPVADRLYLPTADGGRCITDAVSETFRIVNIGRSLANQVPLTPKRGARFHFELPGSFQGFQADKSPGANPILSLENVLGHSCSGSRSLAFNYHRLARGRMVSASTLTFIPPEYLNMPVYTLHASPTLYPGQVVHAALSADQKNKGPVSVCLFISVYGAKDQPRIVYGPEATIGSGSRYEFEWKIGDQGGQPIYRVGLELRSDQSADGTVWLDYLTWVGIPDAVFTRPSEGGMLWRRAWICDVSIFDPKSPEPFRVVQNEGRGLLIQGTHEWADYRVTADIKPNMISSGGICAYVQGLHRYYALLLSQVGKLKLVKVLNDEKVLGEKDFAWEVGKTYKLSLQVTQNRIQAWVDGQGMFDCKDPIRPLTGGAIGLVCEEGCFSTNAVTVRPGS
jgi:ADP-ribosylglycohydrolase